MIFIIYIKYKYNIVIYYSILYYIVYKLELPQKYISRIIHLLFIYALFP